jgi:hypothetical protein
VVSRKIVTFHSGGFLVMGAMDWDEFYNGGFCEYFKLKITKIVITKKNSFDEARGL